MEDSRGRKCTDFANAMILSRVRPLFAMALQYWYTFTPRRQGPPTRDHLWLTDGIIVLFDVAKRFLLRRVTSRMSPQTSGSTVFRYFVFLKNSISRLLSNLPGIYFATIFYEYRYSCGDFLFQTDVSKKLRLVLPSKCTRHLSYC